MNRRRIFLGGFLGFLRFFSGFLGFILGFVGFLRFLWDFWDFWDFLGGFCFFGGDLGDFFKKCQRFF